MKQALAPLWRMEHGKALLEHGKALL